MGAPGAETISAVVVAYNRAEVIGRILDRLKELPVEEVIVADNGSSDGTVDAVRRRGGKVRVLELGSNRGIAARNEAARSATGDYLLMLDDDSYPLPGSIEQLLEAFRRGPRTAVVGGLVRELYPDRVLERQVGTFDWFLRAGRAGDAPPEGFPAYFFPACAALVRRDAFLDVGGFLEPLFFGDVELELATRLIAAGWEVRYLPEAAFEHLRDVPRSIDFAGILRRRIRNQIWYVLLHFPASVAARRIPAYLAFQLVECVYRRAPGAWLGGVADAIRGWGAIRSRRRPLDRPALRRAELNRGRMHLRLLLEMALSRIR
jgi:GT2 family glycosyltransferase